MVECHGAWLMGRVGSRASGHVDIFREGLD